MLATKPVMENLARFINASGQLSLSSLTGRWIEYQCQLGLWRGCRLCRVAGNTVWSHWHVNSRSSEMGFINCYTCYYYYFLTEYSQKDRFSVKFDRSFFFCVPPPSMPGFVRAESIKVLGFTISRLSSVTEHVDNLLKACAQTLFAMRT